MLFSKKNKEFPCFFERFPFFARDLRGSAQRKILVFFDGFPRFCQKARKGRSGIDSDW